MIGALLLALVVVVPMLIASVVFKLVKLKRECERVIAAIRGRRVDLR